MIFIQKEDEGNREKMIEIPLSKLTDGKKFLKDVWMNWSPGDVYKDDSLRCPRPACKQFPKRLYTILCPPRGYHGELVQILKCAHPLVRHLFCFIIID